MTKLSFEFFPPKSLPASFKLWEAAQTLGAFAPEFMSVTYGAGGTTRALTHDTVQALQAAQDVRVAAHLTCVDATQEETLAIAKTYAAAGVRNLVALRGDPPNGTAFRPHPDGFANTPDLIQGLKSVADFTIYVGGYPETHPEAASGHADIAWLKRKLDAGASGAITQFFFEAETFLRFRDRCTAAGITAPLIPGILPIHNWQGIQRFAQTCGTSIPPVLHQAFAKADTPQTQRLLAIAIASELCDDLRAEGVDHLHFYTLNSADITRDICHALGFTQTKKLQKVA
ncbi:methylenetetrahydrofolate reductase [NAD(P)H] [Algirhabdus cladophorae]|uniref:methylenetetrahydrofolate reductase [NAD(P)H] n=1 Tax=Algirhabdus cladophorae TaxID=3377108 RepID=UPI003B8478B7